MKKKITLHLFSFFIFFVTYLIIWKIMSVSFDTLSEPIKAMISGGLTAVIAPRVERYKAQSGDRFQFNWFVLKKSIRL